MTREEHAARLAAILAAGGDVAIVSENVTALSEDYAGMLATSALQSAENMQLKNDKQALIDQNMKLFLKVGAVVEAEPEVVDTKPTFESLFDENGNLK